MPVNSVIGPNEAARMIVRGTLFAAPISIRDKYREFVYPLELAKGVGSVSEDEVNQINNELLDQFVKSLDPLNNSIDIIELEKIDDVDLQLKIVKDQVDKVIAIAETYIANEQFDYYKRELETITGNIKARKIVTMSINSNENKDHQATINKVSYGDSYGAMSRENVNNPSSSTYTRTAMTLKPSNSSVNSLENFFSEDEADTKAFSAYVSDSDSSDDRPDVLSSDGEIEKTGCNFNP